MSKHRKPRISIDPVHAAMDIFAQPITQHVWQEKYRYGEEEAPEQSMQRVCRGVYANDTPHYRNEAFDAMRLGLWVPGGRIQAGAGTPNVVTLLNCYVDQTIDDSMVGIADALKDAMLTQQQGGGIGMDFSTLRPSGAFLHRTGAVASGPLPFMDMWDSMCATIMSAGSRRGAMMATMSDDHPDLPKFITAKQQQGRLTNFNVSVLVSDAFMDAIVHDEEWHLGSYVRKADGQHQAVIERDGGDWYVYEIWQARELWDLITKNTYEYSEPGVIFIDRINDQNNLNYCETIRCTNPCGEQPLPPNGCCNLGAVNLARMVTQPFTPAAEFDYNLLKKVVKIGVRFLDNVIDVALYPLEAQKQEELNKRRIGIGITGLGNALAEMGLRYGTDNALQTTKAIMTALKETAYQASTELAKERGAFPAYSPDWWGRSSPIVKSLPQKTLMMIKKSGIRNGVLLTIAPTGTTSLYVGNVSSGLEPVFLHTVQRKVRQADNSWEAFTAEDYGYRLFRQMHGSKELPPYMVTHEHLNVNDHVRMQAVCQEHVDASVSKTINCPESMTYEEFQLVYWDAYKLGCKGCTTYRPSAIRGSILSANAEQQPHKVRERPKKLTGSTYKVKWPSSDASYYITINEDEEGNPFEMFISSTSSRYSDWTTALSLMVSSIMRLGHDVTFIPEELMKVVSHHDVGFVDGKMYGSLVAAIGDTLRKHLTNGVDSGDEVVALKVQLDPRIASEICPKCSMPSMVAQEGCKICHNCGYSSCG